MGSHRKSEHFFSLTFSDENKILLPTSFQQEAENRVDPLSIWNLNNFVFSDVSLLMVQAEYGVLLF